MYNYLLSSEITLMEICDWTSGWRLSTTLNIPIDFISLIGCINEGLTLIFSISSNNLAISVGFTEPYNSLFSVASFLTLYSLSLILSLISLASFFFSKSFFDKSFLIFSTSLIFSLEAKSAFFLKLKNFLQILS